MLELPPGLGLLFKVASNGLGSLRSRLARRYRRFQPAIDSGRKHWWYPRDLPEALNFGSPRAKALQVLGLPDRQHGDRWQYEYKDGFMQLVFETDEGPLAAIALGFAGQWGVDELPLYWFDRPLGKLDMRYALETTGNDPDCLKVTLGPRYLEAILAEREGPPGAWRYISFGAVDPLVGRMTESIFSCDESGQIATPLEKVMVNWAAVSSSSFNAHFDWTLTFPNS